MNLLLNVKNIQEYKSHSQIARIVTEGWMAENMYCPHCGCLHIEHLANNSPVADFVCPECRNEYELKSKQGSFDKKINDGAYSKMIERITSNENPDFFMMDYSLEENKIRNLSLVPKYFFVPDIIEKRKPLSPNARRAGWVGCNILYWKIPEQGRIPIIIDGKVENISTVVRRTQKSQQLATNNIDSRGWIMDVLHCVNSLQSNEFSLDEMYQFAEILAVKHPQNNNIKPKIRQQLQFLRDKGVIEFVRRGFYKKVRI